MRRFVLVLSLVYIAVNSFAQGKVTSIENVADRTWMCVEDDGCLKLTYSDGGSFKTSYIVSPEALENASFGQLWLGTDGCLRLYYTETNGYYDGKGVLKVMACSNPSSNFPTWQSPETIGIGVCTGRPVEAGNGTWVMPAALWGRTLIGQTQDRYGNDRNREDNGAYKELDYMRGPLTYVSQDKGTTWKMQSGQVIVPEQVYARHNDPQIIVCADGSLKMILRSCGTAWTYASVSKTNGRFWTPDAKRFTQAPDTKTAFMKLPSGRLLMVKNGRMDSYKYVLGVGLYAYLSDDDGDTWYGGLCIDPAEDVEDPSVCSTSNGKITVAYNKEDEGVVVVKTTEDEIVQVLMDPTLVALDRKVVWANKATKQQGAKSPKMTLAKENLRVCSYNIQYPSESLCKWDNRLEALKGFVDEYAPDLIGSQEPYVAQIDDMIKAWDGEYAWFGVNNRNELAPPYYPTAAFNPIFYRKDRLELLDWDVVWYTPKATERGYGADYSRFMIWARFKDLKTGKEFYHFNSHFDHKSDEAKQVAARILVEAVKRIAGDQPAILTGDFNTTETSKAYSTIVNSGFLDNSKLAVKNPLNYLYYSQARYKSIDTVSQKDIHIDHIFFTSANSKVDTWELVIKTYGGYYGSDHLPIVVDWRL